MAFEQRRPEFNLSGTLISGIAPGDLQISSSVFQNLPTDYNTGLYLPLVIADDTQGRAEIVWVTGHAAAGSAVTVQRGREGTIPQSFEAGSVVRCAPTLRDAIPVVGTRAALPTDAHGGMRVLVQAESQVVERRGNGEWLNDSPFTSDNTRRHGWIMTPPNVPSSPTAAAVGGMTPSLGSQGTIATYSNGLLRLNRSGLWFLAWAFNSTHSSPGHVDLSLSWPSGAFIAVPRHRQHRIGTLSGGFPGSSGLENYVSWCGYVSQAQSVLNISPMVAQENLAGTPLVSGRFLLAAEFLGA